MRIKVLSDLHLEFSHIDISCENVDVLVLAGDIHSNVDKLRKFIDDILKRYEVYIIIIAGNHEFYGKNISYTIAQMRENLNVYKTCGNKEDTEEGREDTPSNKQVCFFLENEMVAITIDNVTVKFIGSTLWCNPPEKYHSIIKNSMNDFIRINDFSVKNCVEYHKKSVEYLLKNTVENIPTVIITHFAPSFKSIHPKYGTDPINYYFYTDLEKEIGEMLSDKTHSLLWIHGHTHSSRDYILSGDTSINSKSHCRVVCNPRGYSYSSNGSENPDFNKDLIVEIL